MPIYVKHGTDTYSFASKDGNHYWFLVECERPTFSKCIGMIANFEIRPILYKTAIQNGYTDFDFDQIRTLAPAEKSRFRGSAKPYRSSNVKAPRIVSEKKAAVKKSTLTNSIKLF